MISSEIGVKNQINLRARSKLRVQFVVFENFSSALYRKLHEKSCFYLVIIYMKKVSLKGKANEILTACALLVICIHVPALHPCYMTNALGFSQSEARKFPCIFLV